MWYSIVAAVLIASGILSFIYVDPLGIVGKSFAETAEWLGLIVFLAVIVYFIRLVISTKFNREEALEIKRINEEENK